MSDRTPPTQEAPLSPPHTARSTDWRMIMASIGTAAVVAVGSWYVLHDRGDSSSTSQPTTATASPATTAASSTVASTTSTPTTLAPTTAATTATNPEQALDDYSVSVSATTTSDIATSSCGMAAVVVAPDATHFVTWDDAAWIEQVATMTAAGTDDRTADDVLSVDVTDDGQVDFLVVWNADEQTMHPYGGVLSSAGSGDCTWSWLTIVHPDGAQSTLAEGLYADGGTLHAMDFLSVGGKAAVTMTWDGVALAAAWENTAGDPLANRCTNEIDGYTIAYPATWFTRDDSEYLYCTEFDTIPIVYDDGDEGATEWFRPITVRIAGGYDFDDFISSFDEYPAGSIVSNAPTTINGRRAQRVEILSQGQFEMPEGWTMIDYVIEIDGTSLVEVTGLVKDPTEYDLVTSTLDLMVETLVIN
jgi:hypothetical protein